LAVCSVVLRLTAAVSALISVIRASLSTGLFCGAELLHARLALDASEHGNLRRAVVPPMW
jgi:hypothetical protein